MLEDMVWDDKIVVGYDEESIGSEDETSNVIFNSDDDESDPPDIEEEKIVLNQLVHDLQHMKEERKTNSNVDNQESLRSHVISVDAVTVSHSKDAQFEITGKMMCDWLKQDSDGSLGSCDGVQED